MSSINDAPVRARLSVKCCVMYTHSNWVENGFIAIRWLVGRLLGLLKFFCLVGLVVGWAAGQWLCW